MMNLEDIEAKLRLAKEAKDVERSIDLCERAARHDARISIIKAEDAAEAERSIELLFTPEESAKIFVAAGEALKERHASILEKLS